MSPRKVANAERNDKDLYVTTPEAAVATGRMLERRHGGVYNSGLWLDPAFGFGTYPAWAGIDPERVTGIDIIDPAARVALLDPETRAYLDGIVGPCVHADALEIDWDPDRHILTNTPFLPMRAFIEKIAKHAYANRKLGVVFMPDDWWQRMSRIDIALPEEMHALMWRPNCSDGLRKDGTDGAAPSAEYCVVVFDGTNPSYGDSCDWRRMLKPDPLIWPEEWAAIHSRLARIAAGLTPQGAAPLLDT